MTMQTTVSHRTEMAEEDRAFYVKFGASAALALAIVLLV